MTARAHRAGVTIVELLITITIGVVILGLTFTIVMANRNLMTVDQVNTELKQNLRIGADILGDDLRVAGQGILVPSGARMPLTIANNVITIRNEVREEDGGVLIDVVYLRRYWLDNDILWLRVLRSTDGGANFVNNRGDQGVINKVSTMNVQAVYQGGASLPTLTSPNNWNNLSAVQVQLIGQTDVRGETYTRELTSSFFPRNVLSQ